jgi:membrane-associated protease RseP (regulator of RpoE activity)
VVDSLNRPDAKVTGTSLATAGPASTRLELLLELRPGASSLVGYLDNSRLSGAFETNVESVTTAARIKGRELVVFDAATEQEVETAFIRMALRPEQSSSRSTRKSAAERAGLKPGDLVTEFDGTPVRDAADLQLRLALPPGFSDPRRPDRLVTRSWY